MPDTKDFSFVRALIFLVRWFCMERAIGFGLLFSAAVIAFEPLRTGSLVDLMIIETGLDPFIASSWYLFAALYLLQKGQDVPFAGLLLSIMPMMIIILTAFFLAVFSNDSSVAVNGSDIAREVMIASMIFQKILSKLTVELIERVGGFTAES